MRIGILGGGQLSKMLALAGIPLGLQFSFYFPYTEHSLGTLGKIIHGAYNDLSLLREFASHVDVITYENENIPYQTIEYLEGLTLVHPGSKAIAVSQDRLLEKNFFVNLGVPTNRFIEVSKRSDIDQAISQFGYPFVIKKRTHGYDGKGQCIVNKDTSIDALGEDFFQNSIAEEYVHFDREVSLIMAKNTFGMVAYDPCDNVHKNGILIRTKNCSNDPMFDWAYQYVEKIIESLNYVGVIAVEFFQVNNQLIANEMAPRVHNTGHWTLDASITSQFENHLRAITNLPLGNAASLTDAHMFNILSNMPDKNKLLACNGLCFYDYDKTPAPGRKLGHVTLLGNAAHRDYCESISEPFERSM